MNIDQLDSSKLIEINASEKEFGEECRFGDVYNDAINVSGDAEQLD